MEAEELVQAEDVFPGTPHTIIIVPKIVACRVEVAGIGAEGHAVTNIVSNCRTKQSQLLEGATQSCAAASRRFKQYDRRSRHRPKAPRVCCRVALEAGSSAFDIVAR